jgi:3'-phosphoadenosine 5'-phosphosulfate sulfotransferase (PAPS reductase)/FAD synthetase
MGLYSGRDADDLLASGLGVIDEAEKRACWRLPVLCRRLFPLFSGGHDSYCACWVASRHPLFQGIVYHIDTGIGSQRTRQFAEEVCHLESWTLRVIRSPYTYEILVRSGGFPGPGRHSRCYQLLKKEALRRLERSGRARPAPALLVTGARSQESSRRMSYVGPYRMGDHIGRSGNVRLPHWVWTNPCHDWSADEQRHFMDVNGMPRNPIKMSPLGMSGECFCGCFARPEEFDLVEEYAPDVATEIRRLTVVAKECGKPCGWGYEARQRKEGKVVLDEVLPTGPLCNSCDSKAKASGVIISDLTCSPRVKRSSP